MFKMILSAIVALGFSTAAFANEGHGHADKKETKTTTKEKKKDGHGKKEMKETTTTTEEKPAGH